MGSEYFEERWIEIDDFPGYYISNLGRIDSERTNRFLKPAQSEWGYLFVILRRNNHSFTKYIHRLVAENFIPGMLVNLEVNHIDGDKTNNREDNLEWVTKSENNIHAIRTGLRSPRSTKIRCDQTQESFSSVNECAEYFGGYSTTISAILNGRLKSWRGLTFSYGD